jgi:hypothetical protein
MKGQYLDRTFGDADGVEELQVMPGRWRVQVAAEPEDYPEHVSIWITSSDGRPFSPPTQL